MGAAVALRRRLDGPQGKIALARRWLVLALALVALVAHLTELQTAGVRVVVFARVLEIGSKTAVGRSA